MKQRTQPTQRSPRTQRTVNCPQCGISVPWNEESRFRPFCSERCKTADLSQWAQESYRIPQTEDTIENTIESSDQ